MHQQKRQKGISISCRCYILSSTRKFYINYFKSKSLSSLIRLYNFVRLLINTVNTAIQNMHAQTHQSYRIVQITPLKLQAHYIQF